MDLWKCNKKEKVLRYIIVENLAPMVREMEICMEKNEIVGYEPLVNNLKQLFKKSNIMFCEWLILVIPVADEVPPNEGF